MPRRLGGKREKLRKKGSTLFIRMKTPGTAMCKRCTCCQASTSAHRRDVADCLAHPTLEDTFAMVVLEAMSYGLPVVVSREKYCGIAGLLTDQLNALILDEPKNATALSQLLQIIVDNAELRARLSDEALKFADGFVWATKAQEQEKIYLKITSKT